MWAWFVRVTEVAALKNSWLKYSIYLFGSICVLWFIGSKGEANRSTFWFPFQNSVFQTVVSICWKQFTKQAKPVESENWPGQLINWQFTDFSTCAREKVLITFNPFFHIFKEVPKESFSRLLKENLHYIILKSVLYANTIKTKMS